MNTTTQGSGAVRVVILNFNQPDLTRDCVQNVSNQKYENKKIIVVDNGSSLPSFRTLAQMLPADVAVIRSDRNLGYAAGNNLGISWTGSDGPPDYLLIINNDAFFRNSEGLGKLVQALDGQSLFVACSPLVHNARAFPRDTVCHEVQVRRDADYIDCLLSGSWWLRRIPGFSRIARRHVYGELRPYQTGRIYECDSVNGACFLVKADFLDAIGRLDEGTFMYFEEIVMARQVRNMGKRCCLSTDVVVDHFCGSTSGQRGSLMPIKMYNEYVRSQTYYARKYLGAGVTMCCLLTSLRWFDYCTKAIVFQGLRLCKLDTSVSVP